MRVVEQLPPETTLSAKKVRGVHTETLPSDDSHTPVHKLRELRRRLAVIRRQPLPSSTFRYWRTELGIEADPMTGLYSQDDYDRLRFLVQQLKTGRFSIQQIANQIKRGDYLQNADERTTV